MSFWWFLGSGGGGFVCVCARMLGLIVIGCALFSHSRHDGSLDPPRMVILVRQTYGDAVMRLPQWWWWWHGHLCLRMKWWWLGGLRWRFLTVTVSFARVEPATVFVSSHVRLVISMPVATHGHSREECTGSWW